MADMATGRRVVALEVPEAWFASPEDGDRHQLFYSSLLAALAELEVLIDPVWLPRGAERTPRPAGQGDFTISFHSHGPDAGNVLRCKESYIPPYYSMDPMGYACFSQLARQPELYHDAIARQDADRASSFVRDLAQELKSGNLSKYPQPDYAEGTATNYVFLPLQVQNDSVAVGRWIETPEVMRRVADAAAARGLRTIIKRHPRCRSRRIAGLLDDLAQRPDVVISTASVHTLIANAELVVGANSGVLFEALIQGKPVVSYAAADFGQVTQQVHTPEALTQAITMPDRVDASWRDKFLFWYLTEYCVRADDVPAIRQRISLALDAHPAGLRSGQRAFASYKRRLYAYSLIDRIKRRFF
jgi:hypothetical protein